MSHETLTLPFIRHYRLANGGTRRAIEQCPVRLPVIGAASLARAARMPGGGFLIEHRGHAVSYYGASRDETSVGKVVERLNGRARRRMSAEYRPPAGEAVGDGREALARAVWAFEDSHVIVEGCLAELVEPPGIGLHAAADGSVCISDLEPGFGRRTGLERGPWKRLRLSFPLVRREAAMEVAEAVFARTRALRPGAEPTLMSRFGIEILDAGAVGRWGERTAEARSTLCAVQTVHDLAVPVAGWFTRSASVGFHDLRDALESKASLARFGEILAGFGDEIAAIPDRDGRPAPEWLALVAELAGAGATLDPEGPDHRPRP